MSMLLTPDMHATHNSDRHSHDMYSSDTHNSATRDSAPHVQIDPAILYFGTPVVLVSSRNADGSANLAPMSSAWWLGRSCMLGFGARSATPANIQRTGQCVLNLPSVHEASLVNRLVRTTASDPVPPHKLAMGYEHEADKFARAGATAVPSVHVDVPRVAECPVQLEAELEAVHPMAVRDPLRRGGLVALELRIVAVHVAPHIRMAGHAHRVDPDAWRPLIMSFQRLYGLSDVPVESELARIPEEAYRRGTAGAVVASPSAS